MIIDLWPTKSSCGIVKLLFEASVQEARNAAGGGNGSIMVGMFVSLCLASQKPSERVFFVPSGKDLAVKLLTA
jgi:hypothetical protein